MPTESNTPTQPIHQNPADNNYSQGNENKNIDKKPNADPNTAGQKNKTGGNVNVTNRENGQKSGS